MHMTIKISCQAFSSKTHLQYLFELEEMISWVNLSTLSAQAACLISQSNYSIASLNSKLNY